MTTRIYEGHGVRFAYPSEWQLEESDEDEAATVEVQAPGGLAFALVRSDETGPDPASVADEVLDAMREEYPDLEAAPAMETIAGHHATGYDVEFFSLDITNGASIRSFRTPERTVLVFGQWSDIGDERPARVDPRRGPIGRGDGGLTSRLGHRVHGTSREITRSRPCRILRTLRPSGS